ncbi:unnamed protein product, partial [Closterium sp. NIES-54]
GNALAAGTGAAAAALALAAAGAAAATGSSGLASARRVLSSARAAYSAAAGSAGGGSSGLASASGVLRSARATLPAAAGSASGGSSSGLASARRVLRSARAAFAPAASGGGSGLAAARGVLSGAGASLAAGAGGGSHCACRRPNEKGRTLKGCRLMSVFQSVNTGLQCSKSADIDMETVASADAGGLEVPAVEVTSMQFAYPGEPPLISKFNLTLPRGSRCLLIGANGAGKTTLLRVLAGKHMVGGKDVVKVLGRSAFHDTALSCDGSLAYLGGSWSKSVGCAPCRGPDGQRRRVQICMGLLRPFQVLLLDEVTVDLDVVARMDLLSFFQQECEERGATVVYATHIFDGLESWASHLAFVSSGKLQRLESVDASTQQSADSRKPTALQLPSLLEMVEPWLREDKAKREKEVEEAKKRGDVPKRVDPFAGAGRHMAYYR